MAARRERRISTCSTIARSFGLKTAVLRMSCIYGPHQFGTEDQGWVAHFLMRALRGEPITIYGDGKQVRDILHVNDAVAAYRAMLGAIERVSGRAFNLGGGPANAVSLRAVLDEIAVLTGREVACSYQGWRTGDQLYFVADTRRLSRGCAVARADRLARGTARPGRLGRRGTALAASRTARAGAVCAHEGRTRQSALELRGQHLFRLPRAASAARARLREGEARRRRARTR